MYHSENAMWFAGGSTILNNTNKSAQVKAKASFYCRLKKVIGVTGRVYPYPLYKCMVALTSLSSIALQKPQWHEFEVGTSG